MGVITTPFSRLVVQWYLWISEQVMTKEATHGVSLQGQWLDESNEDSQACLAQRQYVFLLGRSLKKFHLD